MLDISFGREVNDGVAKPFVSRAVRARLPATKTRLSASSVPVRHYTEYAEPLSDLRVEVLVTTEGTETSRKAEKIFAAREEDENKCCREGACWRQQ